MARLEFLKTTLLCILGQIAIVGGIFALASIKTSTGIGLLTLISIMILSLTSLFILCKLILAVHLRLQDIAPEQDMILLWAIYLFIHLVFIFVFFIPSNIKPSKRIKPMSTV